MRLNVIESTRYSEERRLPPWLKRQLPTGDVLLQTRHIVEASGVATVCEEARCPNLSECWSHRHATFMILGDRCTRRCHFCAVHTARPDPVSPDEPQRLAQAVERLGLRHVVITAVARDDLPDEGAGHFAQCVTEIRRRSPDCAIEVLPADFHARDELLDLLVDAEPDIYNHNQETVERLSPAIRPQARYARTLEVLCKVKVRRPRMWTKSGLMVGLGETREELTTTMTDLRRVGVDILTVGQYLRPSKDHAPVARYYEPSEFDELTAEARSLGFASVACGPFVRSSYNAADVYESIKRQRRA
ncbi:MAG: lipoyl synthase [Planctomycetia bacterium]|nr:lipoyl synthase [Planctomycetia bacterium]MCC7313826.1 lipoyl synthase [Planctomycetota bacterium]OQZ06650.1 MAG: lipoyl synthase [Planctomycetes bacterium UTPLA1]